MPRYLTTTGSLFEPFSYEELVAPIKNMAEIHRQTQDAYDTLSMETSALQNYINQEAEDSKARQMYQNYLDKLKTLQDNLWNNGYNAQTRRDLNAAKNGYSSDIVRLQTAIQNRQNRSKEYWDTWHQNPDLVRGADPGIASLDSYLENDRFGQDYYSYSGSDFMKEVAAEAQARREELIRDPKILSAGKIPGYITRLINTGFTNDEVDKAYSAVRMAVLEGNNGNPVSSLEPILSALDGIDDNSAILARTLVSQLESTGALGNLDKTQLTRLLDYGRKGLSAAVGKPDIKDFDDKYFDEQLKLNTYIKQKQIEAAMKGPEEDKTPGYLMDRGYNRNLSSNAGDISKFIGNKFTDKYKDASGANTMISITRPGKETAVAGNAAEMSVQIYDTDGRRTMQQRIPGIDVALPPYDRSKSSDSQQVSDDGNFRLVSISNSGWSEEQKKAAREARRKNGYDDDAVMLQAVGGEWIFNESATNFYYRAKSAHNEEIERIREDNRKRGINIDDYALTPEKLQKIKKDKGLVGVADVDVPTALKRLSVDELRVAPTLVGPTDSDDDKRTRYARLINDFFGSFSSQGIDGLSSQGAAYKISDGSGYSTSSKGVSDKSKIFQLDSEGKIKPSCIQSIQLMPRDINKEGIWLRVRVSNTDGSSTDWAINSFAFGENIGTTLDYLKNELTLATHPLTNPVDGLKSSEEEGDDWRAAMVNSSIFKDSKGYYFPRNEDGSFMTEHDILTDDASYSYYVDLLTARIQQILNRTVDSVTGRTRSIPTNANRPAESANMALPTYYTNSEE